MTDSNNEQIKVTIGEYKRGSRSGCIDENLPSDFLSSPKKHHVVVFPGDGAADADQASLIGHWVDRWLPKDCEADVYSCYYDSPSLAQARVDLISSAGQGVEASAVPYQSRYKDFFDKTFRTVLYDEKGKIRSLPEIQKNLRNMTLVGWCHGSTVTYELENYFTTQLAKAGVPGAAIDKTVQQLSVVNFNPREPVRASKATVVEVLPLSDPRLQPTYRSDVVYQKHELADIIERRTGRAVLPPDKFCVADEILGPAVFQSGNRTLLMPTSVLSSDGSISSASIEHQAVDLLFKPTSKQASQAKDVVQDFFRRAIDSKEPLEVKTQRLDKTWERRKGELLLSKTAAQVIEADQRIVDLDLRLRSRHWGLVPSELMTYMTPKEQATYKALAAKANIDIGQFQGSVNPGNSRAEAAFLAFDAKIRARDPQVIKLQKEIAQQKRFIAQQTELLTSGKQVLQQAAGTAAVALGMYAVGHVGAKYEEYQRKKVIGEAPILTPPPEGRNLALQKAHTILGVGALTTAGLSLTTPAALKMASQLGKKTAARTIGKTAKFVPGVGVVLGAGFAVVRSKEGDKLGATLEAISAACDAGAIVAGSVATGATMAGRLETAGGAAVVGGVCKAASFGCNVTLAWRDGKRAMQIPDGAQCVGLMDKDGKQLYAEDEKGNLVPAVGAVVQYKGGRANGDAVFYDRAADGTIQPFAQGAFVDNKKHGKWVIYDEKGNIREILHYSKGKLAGSYQRFDDQQNLVAAADFKKGEYEEYCLDKQGHSTGIVRTSGKLKDGEPVGDWYVLSTQGKEYTYNPKTKALKLQPAVIPPPKEPSIPVTAVTGVSHNTPSVSIAYPQGTCPDLEQVPGYIPMPKQLGEQRHFDEPKDPTVSKEQSVGRQGTSTPPAPPLSTQSTPPPRARHESGRPNPERKISPVGKADPRKQPRRPAQGAQTRLTPAKVADQKPVATQGGQGIQSQPTQPVQAKSAQPSQTKPTLPPRARHEAGMTQPKPIQSSQAKPTMPPRARHEAGKTQAKPAPTKPVKSSQVKQTQTVPTNPTGSTQPKPTQAVPANPTGSTQPKPTQTVPANPTGLTQPKPTQPPRARHEAGSSKTSAKPSVVGRVDPRKAKNRQYGNGKGIDDKLGSLQTKQRTALMNSNLANQKHK